MLLYCYTSEVKYVNDRQQVVYISNTGRTTEQGPFTKIIWPSTRPGNSERLQQELCSEIGLRVQTADHNRIHGL